MVTRGVDHPTQMSHCIFDVVVFVLSHPELWFNQGGP
jgi:hypothetical protein